MGSASVLILRAQPGSKSTMARALNVDEPDLIAVETESELLSLARRGLGHAVVLDGGSTREPAADLIEELRCVRPELLVFITAPASRKQRVMGSPAGLMIGTSSAIRRVREYTAKVAAMDCNVVIAGETDTGKELVAQSLHRASRRAAKPMLALNCAAIPDSLLESELFGHERGAFTGAVATTVGKLQRAEGGTVFFDELEELSPLAQAKLLRAIETREAERLGGRGSFRINVRVIAATNQDLAELTESGKFRKDLYYRLAVVTITIPPLRDRAEDIPLLAAHFLAEINRELGAALGPLTGDAIAALQAHHWPGNVRELRNVLEAVAVEKQQGAIVRGDLPVWFQPARKTYIAGPSEERSRMIQALESARWNKAKAARELSWSRMTLYRKMAKHEISAGPAARSFKAAGGHAG